MKDFIYSNLFELQYPDNWSYLHDKTSDLHCFCKDTKDSAGAFQITSFVLDSNTFDAKQLKKDITTLQLLT